MDADTIAILTQIIGYFIGGAIVYAAIRADLAVAKVKAEQALDLAAGAHKKIFEHVEVHHTHAHRRSPE